MMPAATSVSVRDARQAVVLVAKIVVSTALLYWLLHGTDLARLWLYARKASPAWLTLALGLFLAQVLYEGDRLKPLTLPPFPFILR